MPTTFSGTINYGGHPVTVNADSFAELHQALAGIEELNRDAAYMHQQGIHDVVPVYRQDDEENSYYGFQDRNSRRNITFGTKRKAGVIPFFPKGAEGYYEPEGKPTNGREGYRPKGRISEQQPTTRSAQPNGSLAQAKRKLAKVARAHDFDLQAELAQVVKDHTGGPARDAAADELHFVAERIERGEIVSAKQRAHGEEAQTDDVDLPF